MRLATLVAGINQTKSKGWFKRNSRGPPPRSSNAINAERFKGYKEGGEVMEEVCGEFDVREVI